MDNQIKYTTDGKKVVVIGNLNSQEKIVQEIFIVNGSEIPSGEHFIVKSLHDAPAISWKEKRIKEIDEQYAEFYEKKKTELEKLERLHRIETDTIQAKISFLSKFKKKLNKDSFSRLEMFLSGKTKFMVLDNYGSLEICKYDEAVMRTDYGRFDSLRLLSVYGSTDGDILYKINDYSDGSGSSKFVYPCETMEDALKTLKELFYKRIEKGLWDSHIKVAEKYNIDIPKDLMDVYNAKKQEELNKNILSYSTQVTKWKGELDKYK